MTTALEGGEGSVSRPGRSLPPRKTRYPLYRRLDWPQGWSGQVRKISSPPGFDPRTVQPVASRYTEYATRPTFVRITLSQYTAVRKVAQFPRRHFTALTQSDHICRALNSYHGSRSVVCCHVEVSAIGRSLIQRSPTECVSKHGGVAAKWRRSPRLTRALEPPPKKIQTI